MSAHVNLLVRAIRSRRCFSFLTAMVVGMAVFCGDDSPVAAASGKPNVIVIVADDKCEA